MEASGGGASSPEHVGNPDLAYPPSSPHFRPNMQSPGPPYQGSLSHGMDYSERSYEAQMGSHCQSAANYPSAYHQPPSPYRPHPVSPTAAQGHQYGNHQMHAPPPTGYGTSSAHQLGPYSASSQPPHYGPVGPQDPYAGRHAAYNGASRGIQQAAKSSAWTDGVQASYQAPRSPMITSPPPPHMPPPPIRSPPHSSIAPSVAAPAAHYRQLSSPSHSPHPTWPQSQIPSPGGVMHSPRTTPSPLPNHARSPGHQPFSPPPPTPSPAAHQQPKAPSASPGPTRQPACASPTNPASASSPLQSLQKMVMLDASEPVESPMPVGGRPHQQQQGSYFSSVEQLAGSDPGSPYPTYYNLDQNRLCTPPRTSVSTPTSSTYSSAPDCASSNSNSIDSNNLAVDLVNGDCKPFVPRGGLAVANGESSSYSVPCAADTSDSESKSVQEDDRRIPKSVRGRRKSFPLERSSEAYRFPDRGGRAFRGKSPLLATLRNNPSAIYASDFANGGSDDQAQEDKQQPRFSSPPPSWQHFYEDDPADAKRRRLSVEEHLVASTAAGMKRGPRRHRGGYGLAALRPGGGAMLLVDQKAQPVNLKSPAPRGMRGSGRRGGRRRIGMANGRRSSGEDFDAAGRLPGPPDGPQDDKMDAWQVPNLHVGPSPSADDERARDPSAAVMGFPYREAPEFENPAGTHDPSGAMHHVAPTAPNATPDVSIMDPAHSPSSQQQQRHAMPPMASPTAGSDTSPRKKRGRPFGSKNKPKLPGEKKERKPGRRKQKDAAEAEGGGTVCGPPADPKAATKKARGFSGPFVHIVGSKERPLSITVVNVPPREEEKDPGRHSRRPPQVQQPPGDAPRRRPGVGHTSTLSPQYDATTKDRSWVCALCHKGSHHRGLGDLFGPYFLGEDQKPSAATPSSGVPSVSSVANEEADESNPEAPSAAAAACRKVRSKRKRSKLVEEFFRSAMSKKGRQASSSSAEPSEQSLKTSEIPKGKSAPDSVSSLECPSPSPSPLQVPPTPEAVENENEVWVHEDCVVWCNGVFLVGHRVQGVEEAVREASEMVCCKCKLTGATLGCLNKGCTAQFHFICAKERGCEMDEDNFSLYCPKHKKTKTEQDEVADS